MLRVLLDANVVVSGWLQGLGPSARILDAVAVVAADPDDDKYLAAAIEGRAGFLVSGDRHLLDLGHHEGVRILSPRAFLEVPRGGRDD